MMAFPSGEIFIGTATGLLSQLCVQGRDLQVVSTRVLCSEPVSLTAADGDHMWALSHSKSFQVSKSCQVRRLRIADSSSDTTSMCPVGPDRLAAVSGGDVHIVRRPHNDGHGEVFQTTTLANVVRDESEVTAVIAIGEFGYAMLLYSTSCPVVTNPFTCESLDVLYELGIVSAAASCVINNQQSILVWSVDRSELCLLDVHTSGSDIKFAQVWAKPEPDCIHSIVQLGNNRVVCATSTGEVRVYAVSRTSLPHLLSSRQTRAASTLLVSKGRIFLVSPNGGVSTLLFRQADNALMFTSVAAPSIPTVDSMTSCTLLDHNHVAVGTSDGQIQIYRVPGSVASDEQTQMFGLSASASPDLCMAVTEVVASMTVKGSVSSLVHCGDERNVVYYTSSAGRFGAVFPLHAQHNCDVVDGFVPLTTEAVPDELLRYRLKGHWAWD